MTQSQKLERMRRSLLLQLVLVLATSTAFEWSARPGIDRRSIAGLWRLVPRTSPMKEFTTYPKREEPKEPELLLMLKDDGSFQRYNSEDTDVSDQWSHFQKRPQVYQMINGTWDLVDGKLILAADRPKNGADQDTILEGRVVVTSQTSLQDNPVVNETSAKDTAGSTATATRIAVDTHLSVPKGSVKVGKFFYPKNHPSFFDQPIFQPVRRGAFMLKQVLGAGNAAPPEQDVLEKYHRADFYNKTFLLTSHPIKQRLPKGNKRWSIKYNKYIEEPVSPEARKAAEEEAKRAVPIRVMQVQFFPNNTFATVAGTGESILRGKFDVIGQDKDQLWMQVWRFGFGRSVSGSVYSEGKHLTQDDAKSYWGTITPELNENGEPEEDSGRLEVKGSVLFGSGLEPLPVARFIMREVKEEETLDALLSADDDDDDEDEINDEKVVNLELLTADESSGPAEDGLDLSGDLDDAFQ